MVTREEVLHIAALARIALEADEIERITDQLATILGHVEALQRAQLDEEDAADTAVAPLAADRPGADPLLHPLAAIAPVLQDGFFTVPRLAALGQDGAAPDDAGA